MNYGGLKTTEKGPHDRGATLRRYLRLPGWCPRPQRRCTGRRQRQRSAEADQGSILLAQGDLDRQHLQPVPVLLACLLEPRLIIVRLTAVTSGFVVVPHRWVGGNSVRPDNGDSPRTASNSGSPRGDSHPRGHRHHAAPLRSPKPKALASFLNVETASWKRVAIDHHTTQRKAGCLRFGSPTAWPNEQRKPDTASNFPS